MPDTLSHLGMIPELIRPPDGSTCEIAGDLIPQTTFQKLQSMAVMGELAEAVAHDFNNIVSATLIHLGLLLQDSRLNTVQRESLKTLEQETTRAAALTRQLLSFSRRRFAAKTEAIDLNKLLYGVEKLLDHLVRENVSLSFQPAAEACWIEADTGQIEKLVMSLCLVSRDLMPKGGRIVLKTGVFDGDDLSISTDVPREAICLTLTATGNGEDSSHESISGHLEGESGWPLDTARQIVQIYRGRIEIKRETLSTEFRVYFPPLDLSKRNEQASRSPEEIKGGSETILLIEDEDFLRRVSALSLRKLGYAVLDAADSDAAMQMWEKHHEKIDLVLADLLLPGAESGYELAQLFIAQKPSLKIMLSSGNHSELDEYSRLDGTVFFQAVKPYSASRLAQMVRECLDASS